MGVYDGSIGAFVFGTLVSTCLLGVTATQAWKYYSTFPEDRRLYFYVVSFLLVLDWVHSAFSCYTIYDWCVTHFGDIAYLQNAPWSFAVDPAMTGVVTTTVQVFYAYRVYVMGDRKLAMPIVICVFSAIQLGFSCAGTAQIFYLKEFAKFPTWRYGVTSWLVCASVADILITASLVYYLHRGKQNILQATTICEKLIKLVIETNGLTAICAVLDAVLFATLTTSYHVAVNLCLVKLYFNSLLVSLNARADLEKHVRGASNLSRQIIVTSESQTSEEAGNWWRK